MGVDVASVVSEASASDSRPLFSSLVPNAMNDAMLVDSAMPEPTIPLHIENNPEIPQSLPRAFIHGSVLRHDKSKFRDCDLQVLIDNGAEISLVREDVLPLEIVAQARPVQRNIGTWSGLQSQTTDAEVFFSMNCSGITIDVRAYIVKEMHYDLLIGANVIGHNNISVSTTPLGEHHITAGNPAREIPCISNRFVRFKARAQENLVIPPGVSVVALVHLEPFTKRKQRSPNASHSRSLEASVLRNRPISVELTSPFRSSDAVGALYTCSGVHGTPIVLRNESGGIRKVSKGQVLGFATPAWCESDVVCTVEDLPVHSTTSIATDSSAPCTKADGMNAVNFVCSTADGQSLTSPRASSHRSVDSLDASPHVTDTVPTPKLGPSLSPQERKTALSVIDAGGGCLVTDLKVGGVANIQPYSQQVICDRPVRQAPRPLNPAKEEIMKKEIEKMLESGVIEEHRGPWASPVLLVKKKDGSWRFCIDYRRLNDVTVSDVYPIPRIDRILQSMNGSKFFSVLDLASGYWQIGMDPESASKAAFVTPSGQYAPKVITFGLKNAPAAFQRALNQVLGKMVGKFCFVYIDDVIIFSKTFEEHCEHVKAVLKALEEANLRAKASKCSWFQSEVEYLGHRLSKDGIAPLPTKTEAIRNMKPPSNVALLRSFLGMANYYREFVRDYAIIASPLFKLLKKDQRFLWEHDQEVAFNKIKKGICDAVPLAFPVFEKDVPFILITDASNHGMGAVLKQVVNGDHRTIAFWSSGFDTVAQSNYCATDREMLAILRAVMHFRFLLDGCKVEVYTDHQALVNIFKSMEFPMGMRGRWLAKLQMFNLEVKYLKGKDNEIADHLSRAEYQQGNGSCEVCAVDLSHETAKHFHSKRNSRLDKLVTSTTHCNYIGGTDLWSNKQMFGEARMQSNYPAFVSHVDSVFVSETGRSLSASSSTGTSISIREVKKALNRVQSQYAHAVQPPGLLNPSAWFSRTQSVNYADATTTATTGSNSGPKFKPATLSLGAHKRTFVEWQKEDDDVKLIRELMTKHPDLMILESEVTPTQPPSAPNSAPKSDKKVKSPVPKDLRPLNAFEVKDGILYRASTPVLPKALVTMILETYHDSLLDGGHSGKHGTWMKVKDRYWWRGMNADVNRHVAGCSTCKMANARHHRPFGRLHPLPPASHLFEIIGIDMIGPLPITKNNNRSILVCIDHYTHWIEAFALPNEETQTIIDVLMKQVVTRFGPPKLIVTDQGTNFKSNLAEEFYSALRSKHVTTTPYHPQTNGLTERYNGVIKTTLTKFANHFTKAGKFEEDWDEILPYVLYSLRTTPSNSTRALSPYQLVFGFQPRHPLDSLLATNENNDVADFVQEVRKRKQNKIPYEVQMQARFKFISLLKRDAWRSELGPELLDERMQAKKKLAEKANIGALDPPFKLGDYVYRLKGKAVGPMGVAALVNRYEGPYRIIKVEERTDGIGVKFKDFTLDIKPDDKKHAGKKYNASHLVLADFNLPDNVPSLLELNGIAAGGRPIDQTRIEFQPFPESGEPIMTDDEIETMRKFLHTGSINKGLTETHRFFERLVMFMRFLENNTGNDHGCRIANSAFEDLLLDFEGTLYPHARDRLIHRWNVAEANRKSRKDLSNFIGLLRSSIRSLSKQGGLRVKNPT